MFDKLVDKFTNKMSHSVKTTIAPIKDEVKKNLDNKVDLYSKVLKFAILVFLFIDGTKRINKNSNDSETTPNHIIINNYVYPKGEEK